MSYNLITEELTDHWYGLPFFPPDFCGRFTKVVKAHNKSRPRIVWGFFFFLIIIILWQECILIIAVNFKLYSYMPFQSEVDIFCTKCEISANRSNTVSRKMSVDKTYAMFLLHSLILNILIPNWKAFQFRNNIQWLVWYSILLTWK